MMTSPEPSSAAACEARPISQSADSVSSSSVAPSRLPVALVLLLAAALRLGLWLGYGGRPDKILNPDSEMYWLGGLNLVHHGFFSGSPNPPLAPMIYRVPGFPLFLGVLNRFLGLDQRAIILVQLFLSLLVVWGVWRLLLRPSGRGPALLAALLLATDCATIVYGNILLTETLYTVLGFALLLGIWSAGERRDGWGLAAACGLGCAALTLIRPIAVMLFVPLALYLAFAWWRRRLPVARVAALLAVFVAGAVLPVGAWMARNHHYTGSFMLNTGSAENLYCYRAAWDQAALTGRPFDEVFNEFNARLAQMRRSGAGEAEIAAFCTREGRRILSAHPLLTFKQGVQSAVKLMFGIASAQLDKLNSAVRSGSSVLGNAGELSAGHLMQWAFGGRSPVVILLKGLALVHLILLYAGILLLLARLRRLDGATLRLLALCAIIALYYIALSAGTGADARFRVPFAPMLAVPSALGWAWLVNRRRTVN